ncbi:MAG: CoA-transferase [Aggregatilineales bacterium]
MTTFVELHEAAQIVESGWTLALGGMTLYRRPAAFVYALLKRDEPPKNLTLLNFTAGYESDLLVGSGCVETVRSVYFGLESFGLAPMFTDAASKGLVNIIEETEASIVMGIRATLAGVGFMPSRAWIGTDLPDLRRDVKTVIDPYTEETLMAFPAIHIDCAVLHGLAADREGNVVLNNNLGIDMELVYAAKRVIVTVERLIDRVEKQPETTIIPAPGVDYVSVAPRGAFPTSCFPDYPIDGETLMRYVDMCNAGEFDQYVQQV